MTPSLQVAEQVFFMVIVTAVGFVACKKNIFTTDTAREVSGLLLSVVTPSMMIHAFIRPLERSELAGFFWAVALSAAFHAAAVALTVLLIRRHPQEKHRAERMGAIFSNCGFMAFPIISAVVGEKGLLYGCGFVAVFNIALWTAGLKILDSRAKMGARQIFLNPGMISFAIGLAIYLFQIPVPSPIKSALGSLSAVNTPVAMMIIGAFLTQVDFGAMFRDVRVYFAAAVRTLILPFMFIGLMMALGFASWSPEAGAVATSIALCSACTSATSSIMMTARMGLDSGHGAKVVAMTTLYALGTLPLVMAVCARVF